MSERINQHKKPLIGQNIKRLRTEKGFKAVNVVEKLKSKGIIITTGVFSKVENGYNNPTVEMLIALTEIFSCDFNEFFKK